MSGDARSPLSITELVVVVPVRDEAELLSRCLRSLERAHTLLQQRCPQVASHSVVVLDRCRDRSPAIAAAHDCDAVDVDHGRVGAARAAGVARARATAREPDSRRIWVASTDADSEVPETWLAHHVDAAAAGAGMALGPVRPDPADLSPALVLRWQRRERELGPRERVHGANLGVRLSSYEAAGGFGAVPEHEDVLLVQALRRAGEREATLPALLTSARRSGRTPGGFAGYLRSLVATPALPGPAHSPARIAAAEESEPGA